MTDLFGQWPPSPADGIMGMKVRLDRAQDHVNPCCENIAIIAQGKGPHAAQLCCEHCWRHLGWLSKTAIDFLTQTVRLFGVPDEPFQLCDATPGVNPMRKADALPSKYIRATDIGSREWPLTIVQTRMEKVGQDDTKPVMRFKEVSSGLVLNGVNWDTLAAAYGEDSDAWNGKPVVLYAAETTMKGKPTLGTRVRIPESSTAAKPKLVAAGGGKSKPALGGGKRGDLDDEIPF
jgi:hypothetical protein